MDILTPEERADLIARKRELRLAIGTGARQITHGDKTIVYKSQSELEEAIAYIDRQLGSRKIRAVKISPDRGLR
jgi:hypothetical protein